MASFARILADELLKNREENKKRLANSPIHMAMNTCGLAIESENELAKFEHLPTEDGRLCNELLIKLKADYDQQHFNYENCPTILMSSSDRSSKGDVNKIGGICIKEEEEENKERKNCSLCNFIGIILYHVCSCTDLIQI